MASFEEQFRKAKYVGIAGFAADVLATSIWMHRDYTHNSIKLNEPLTLLARTIIWGTTVKPREWAAVHRKHHKFSDLPGDPHSPVQNGRYGFVKVAIGNKGMYGKAAKEVVDSELPPDLQPDKLDKLIFDKPKLGLAASLVGHVIVNKLAGNPAYMGAVSWGYEKAEYVAAGNAVNSAGHMGELTRKTIKKVLSGYLTPHEDGTYGSDNRVLALLTGGESNQRAHHEDPNKYFFSEKQPESRVEQFIVDAGGAVGQILIDTGWAEPGPGLPPTEDRVLELV